MTGTNTDFFRFRGIFARISWLITLLWIEIFTSFKRQNGHLDTFKLSCKNEDRSFNIGDTAYETVNDINDDSDTQPYPTAVPLSEP